MASKKYVKIHYRHQISGKFKMFEPDIVIMVCTDGWDYRCLNFKHWRSGLRNLSKIGQYFKHTLGLYKYTMCVGCKVKYRCDAYSLPHIKWLKEKKFGLCEICQTYVCNPLYMYLLYKMRDFLPKNFKVICCICQEKQKELRKFEEQDILGRLLGGIERKYPE